MVGNGQCGFHFIHAEINQNRNVHASCTMFFRLQSELGQLDFIDAPGIPPAIDKEIHVLENARRFDAHRKISSM